MEVKGIMNLNQLSIDDLKQLGDKEFIDLLFKTLSVVKPVVVKKVDVPVETMDAASFDLVRKMIKYEYKDDCFVVTIPSGDEREDPFYQVKLFSKDTYDLFPPVGYFIFVGGSVLPRTFGLLDIQFFGQHIERNPNDYRFYKFNTQYVQNEHFYYDSETGKYVQVNDNDLIQGRRRKERGEPIEKEEVQEYLRREELFRYSRMRLKTIGKSYLQEFINFKPYWKYTPRTLNDVESFFIRYKKFLDSMELGMKVKLLLSRITEREYEKLMEHRDHQYQLMFDGIKLLEEIAMLMMKSHRYRDIKNYHLGELFGDSLEQKLYVDFVNNVLMKIQEFLTPREDKPFSLLQGYIGYDLEREELYPNIVELERRDVLRDLDKPWKTTEERDLEMKILKNLRKRTES
jgi:hypothetical protein